MNEEAIFAEALAKKTEAERAAYLDEVCRHDVALRNRVETLLRSHESAGSFLGKPAIQFAAEELGVPVIGDATQPELPVDGDVKSLSFLSPSDKPNSLGRLSHYEVLEVIGRGAMGIVFRAFDEKLHRVVAIKVMAPELATTSPPRKRFLREARSAAAVRHENVVDIHAVEEQPIPYMVMEYVRGETLQQKHERVGPFEVPEVLRLGQQIARGLAAAHERGLIHRDIKPSNILLEKGTEERVKITDFGLARAVADASLTHSGVIAGTPMYMAPEQVFGDSIDYRADLFSLGSVLYTICSGRPPFRATTSMATLKRVADDAPRPIRDIIPEVPEWLCDIISKLQAKKPEDRFQSAKEVADLLDRALANLERGNAVVLEQKIRLPEQLSAAKSQKALVSPEPKMQASGLPHRWHRGSIAAAVLFLVLGGLSLGEATGVTNLRATVIRIFNGDGTLVVEVNDPAVKVTIEGDGGLMITGAGPQEVRLRPGSYRLQAAKDGKPVPLDQELVSITRGDKRVVRVAVEPAKSAPPGRPTFKTPWSDSDDWVIEGNELVQAEDSSSDHSIFFGDPGWTDYNFEAEAKIVAVAGRDVRLGVDFRATGRNSLIQACLSPATKGIDEKGKRLLMSWNGKFVGFLGQVPGEVIVGRWYRMRIEARGGRFKFFVDGKLLASVYNEEFPLGCVGLITRNASGRFRNLKVTDPKGKVLFEGLQNVLPKRVVRVAVEPNKSAPPVRPAFITPWSDSDDWVLKGQEVHQLDESNTGHVLEFGDPNWTDYDFEAEAQLIAGISEMGIIFRGTGPYDRLYASIGAFENKAHAIVAKGPLCVSQTPGRIEKGRWYRLRIQARGNRFKVFLDGKSIMSAYVEGYSRGCVGLVTVGARACFRNMKVTDPEGKVLFEGVQKVLPN